MNSLMNRRRALATMKLENAGPGLKGALDIVLGS